MVVVVFDTASPAVGTDVFAANAVMSRYTKGKNSKVMAIALLGGTELCKIFSSFGQNLRNFLQRVIGTGKFDLMYGADEIAVGLQSQNATLDFTTIKDYQTIVDGRWCNPSSQMSLMVSEAPGATITVIVWLLQGMK